MDNFSLQFEFSLCKLFSVIVNVMLSENKLNAR